MSLAGPEWWRPLPAEVTADGVRLLLARGVRAFADGFVALLLPLHLAALVFDGWHIGAIVTATLLGSAATTLAAASSRLAAGETAPAGSQAGNWRLAGCPAPAACWAQA